ncbi:hypothetical protein cyc_00123 [Cyclospora cayetanensis]|uniref:Uncharacterized protein n=1 Tax=Cyclospora cayetanensis TaxID=88456 RepID=A0A1D3D4Q2_9EIME|nr:hypothetical protein cyc_00123 [Cyclospora cayetanensis]
MIKNLLPSTQFEYQKRSRKQSVPIASASCATEMEVAEKHAVDGARVPVSVSSKTSKVLGSAFNNDGFLPKKSGTAAASTPSVPAALAAGVKEQLHQLQWPPAGGPSAAPVKKRGRPRKYPRPEDLLTAPQGPTQTQVQHARDRQGPVREKRQKADACYEAPTDDHLSRPRRNRAAITSRKQQRGGADEQISGHRGKYLWGVKPQKRSPSPPTWGPSSADESSVVHAGKQQEEESFYHLMERLPQGGNRGAGTARVGEGAADKEEAVLLWASTLARQHRTPRNLHSQEAEGESAVCPLEIAAFEGQGATTSSLEGNLSAACLHDVGGEAVESVLLPYYRRCLQLLLANLLGCLPSLSYSAAALLERERAILRCLSFAASSSLPLSSLQILIDRFGKCVKALSAPSELEKPLQLELVEDMLLLSRLVGQDPAPQTAKHTGAAVRAAAAAGANQGGANEVVW